MERRFDATLKSLLEEAPEDWPRLLGIPDPHVRVIDADISTISGAADKVLRLRGMPPSILHLEFQSGPDASLPCDLNVYKWRPGETTRLASTDVPVLLGPMVEQLLQGVLGMKESVTYQAIVAEGESKGARKELRKVLRSQGEGRFGAPAPAWVDSALEQINSLEELEALAKQILRVESWAELLPQSGKLPRRKKGSP